MFITDINAANKEIARLNALLVAAYTDAAYGCMTRSGLTATVESVDDSKDIVFLDLDGMHNLNAQLGYAEVDARIKASLSTMRADDVVVARWYSGDEIVLIVPAGDGAGAAQRLRKAMVANGLSATFGVVNADGSLEASVNRAAALVQAAKADSQSGMVNHARGTIILA